MLGPWFYKCLIFCGSNRSKRRNVRLLLLSGAGWLSGTVAIRPSFGRSQLCVAHHRAGATHLGIETEAKFLLVFWVCGKWMIQKCQRKMGSLVLVGSKRWQSCYCWRWFEQFGWKITQLLGQWSWGYHTFSWESCWKAWVFKPSFLKSRLVHIFFWTGTFGGGPQSEGIMSMFCFVILCLKFL